MEQRSSRSLGLVLGTHIAPEHLVDAARTAERAGFGELWLAEDFFFPGGVASSATVLSATSRMQVCLGPVSVMARHPALLAMEVATLARLHPGRVRLSLALGAPTWLRQMGLMPTSPLRAMRECVGGVRRLLDGGRVSCQGDFFHFDDVALSYPQPVEIDLAVVGPKMLGLSGELADGSVLAVASSLDYVRWSARQIRMARDRTAATRPHRTTMFALYAVDPDRERARQAVRDAIAFYKSVSGRTASTDVYGISDQVVDMRSRGGAATIAREMPEEWLDDLAIAGTPDECVEKLRAYFDAGVDAITLVPCPVSEYRSSIGLTAEAVLPAFS
jgi:alkanesulfonate monooxygenase SsuD/methylene tetrahydromethanopterin reductase-like flavin-dependent oxidoreductase (luciferase family)